MRSRRERYSLLREAIYIYPKWTDDAELIAACESGSVPFVGIRDSFRMLKTVELDLRAAFASLYATLYARRTELNGEPLPTIEQLEALGVEWKDPVSGKPYECRDFEGKKRLFGLKSARPQPTEMFLILSNAESVRESARKK